MHLLENRVRILKVKMLTRKLEENQVYEIIFFDNSVSSFNVVYIGQDINETKNDSGEVAPGHIIYAYRNDRGAEWLNPFILFREDFIYSGNKIVMIKKCKNLQSVDVEKQFLINKRLIEMLRPKNTLC